MDSRFAFERKARRVRLDQELNEGGCARKARNSCI